MFASVLPLIYSDFELFLVRVIFKVKLLYTTVSVTTTFTDPHFYQIIIR